MAPYAIAHLKIGLKLYETGYRFDSDERARIYLTNALEPAQDFSDRLEFAFPRSPTRRKRSTTSSVRERFTVVIGNPPYCELRATTIGIALHSRACLSDYKQRPQRAKAQS